MRAVVPYVVADIFFVGHLRHEVRAVDEWYNIVIQTVEEIGRCLQIVAHEAVVS